MGGSREPMELFVAFRGREPSVDALLRHAGIAA
jgi:oligopeptidase A